MKEMHPEIINTLESSFDELETNRQQMKGLYQEALNTIDTRIEEMKNPTSLYKRLFERNMGKLVGDKRQEIQELKQDITRVEQQLTAIIDDQKKLVALKNADIPAPVLEPLRELETYYQNGRLSDAPADLEAQRQQLQTIYRRYVDIPRKIADLSAHLVEDDRIITPMDDGAVTQNIYMSNASIHEGTESNVSIHEGTESNVSIHEGTGTGRFDDISLAAVPVRDPASDWISDWVQDDLRQFDNSDLASRWEPSDWVRDDLRSFDNSDPASNWVSDWVQDVLRSFDESDSAAVPGSESEAQEDIVTEAEPPVTPTEAEPPVTPTEEGDDTRGRLQETSEPFQTSLDDQNLRVYLVRYYHDHGDLTHTQYQALNDLHARYVRSGEQIQELKSTSRLKQGDIPTIMRLDNGHQEAPLLGDDREALRVMHERYIGAQSKIRDLLDSGCVLPKPHKSLIEGLDLASQKRLLTDEEFQSIRDHHERYVVPFKQLTVLKEISQVVESDRQELAHIEAEYYHDALGDDALNKLAQLHNDYTQRYIIPDEQLAALQASKHVVYSDQQTLEQINTALRQGNITDAQRIKLQELHDIYILPAKLLSELAHATHLSDHDRGEINRLDTAYQRGTLIGTSVDQLRNLYEQHITQANQLHDLKQMSPLSLNELQDLVQLDAAHEDRSLNQAGLDQLAQIYDLYTAKQSPIENEDKSQYGNIYKEYQQQIKQKKRQISVHEERLQAMESRQTTKGSFYVNRKLYEFKTRRARTWLEGEINAIENNERIATSLPDAVLKVLQRTDAEKGLKELHKAETDVLRQWENIDHHVDRVVFSIRSLLQNESIIEEAMMQRNIDKYKLRNLVKEHQELKQKFASVLEQYQKTINSETLVNVHQNYHNTLHKHILAPTRSVISNTNKIDELEYVITATKEYMDELSDMAARRNSVISKMTYLIGRSIENVGAGFAGGVGSAFVRNGMTPTTAPGGGIGGR